MDISDRIVTGYHGTSASAIDGILESGFKASDTKYEWLGAGVYFFEDAPRQAFAWARDRFGDEARVLRCGIRLGECLDRLDDGWNEHLRQVHEMVLLRHRQAGIRLPTQDLEGKAHGIDCGVINLACGLQAELGLPVIDTVRSPFREGEPLYVQSAFHMKDHVQICVRTPANILDIELYEEN